MSTSRSSARAVATHALNERMKEMNERIEAMDQISQNIDREFKSSRVVSFLLGLIDESFPIFVQLHGNRSPFLLIQTVSYFAFFQSILVFFLLQICFQGELKTGLSLFLFFKGEMKSGKVCFN